MSKNIKKKWNTDNSYLELPSKLYTKQLPEKCFNPKLLYYNYDLAKRIGCESLSKSEILDIFSGNKLSKSHTSISQAYAGHQFGHFNILGDGRAVLLCEQIAPDNIRYDIQLKGSGQTPYSRRGDGKATITSVLREYLMSEAMFYLNIPTTRSLAVIESSEKIFREKVFNRGILTRVSLSHIRFGTFEFVRKFCTKDEMEIFIKYVINRHFPQISNSCTPVLNFFELVMQKQVDLIVDWMRVGFIHGVMNTDNMSIPGETIDYGPCAFMNIYNPDTAFSSIDVNRRYSFGNQPKITFWNLNILANTLIPLISNNEENSKKIIRERMDKFPTIFKNSWYNMMFKKLGIISSDNEDKILVKSLLRIMEKYKLDYNNTFAALTMDNSSVDFFLKINEFKNWKERWKNRLNNSSKSLKSMKKQNPIIIPRNHLVEEALENTINGDFTNYNNLLNLISKPYDYNKSDCNLQTTPKGFDDSYRTFCGT
ncbi:MAG: hypothetical protein CMF96_05115 [Candidatus Marinimicrobia bacterium]|nr:hypothetical protein [Candidatus Neomarinimicrobiota bacterium]